MHILTSMHFIFLLKIINIHISVYGYGLNTGHFNSYIVFYQISIICLAIYPNEIKYY